MNVSMNLPAGLAARLAGGDERLAVTGASGWFGMTTLELLLQAMGPDRFARRVIALASVRKRILLRDGATIDVLALEELPKLRPRPDHILHYAYPVRDRVADLGVDRFVRMTAEIALTMLRMLEERSTPVFFTSAGSVYGAQQAGLEADPYGSAKRLDELVLRQACHDAGTSSVVARVFSVSGPYMTRHHVYALADFITQVKAGLPLVVRSNRLVHRSYVAVSEVVAVGLSELLDPSLPDVIFDTAGDEIIEVGQLAARVRDALGHPELPVVRSSLTDLPPDDYYGDGSLMRDLADRHGVERYPLDDQIRQTAAFWN